MDGYPCGDASGLINISGSQVTGNVTTSWGDIFDLTGEVASTGYVSGGFAVADYSVATYDGQMYSNGGNGTWEDIYECSGTWNAQRK